jgi:hypothetical protein
VTKRLPVRPSAQPAPLMARLLDSVAPEVKMISSGWAPMALARRSRADSTSFAAAHPYACVREAAFPNCSVMHGSIASTTLGSTGVVALWSM